MLNSLQNIPNREYFSSSFLSKEVILNERFGYLMCARAIVIEVQIPFNIKVEISCHHYRT